MNTLWCIAYFCATITATMCIVTVTDTTAIWSIGFTLTDTVAIVRTPRFHAVVATKTTLTLTDTVVTAVTVKFTVTIVFTPAS